MKKTKQKLKVLHLISSLAIGGAERLLVDLIKVSNLCSSDKKCYNKSNNDVEFIIVIINDVIDEELRQQLISTGYSAYFLNKKERDKNPKYLFKLLDIVKKHDIDIIHSHNNGSKYWAILCKLINYKLKLVHTIHDSVIFKKPDKLSLFKHNSFTNPIMNLFKNNNIKKTTLVYGGSGRLNLFIHKIFIDMNIAISKAILEECNNNGIKKKTLIYNGIDTKRVSNITRQHNRNMETLNIINVSRITYHKKGQDILIKALKECKDKGLNFTCSFVGGVYDYDKASIEYLKDLIKNYNLENEISFLGNRNDIPDLLAKADLFILPSRHEGLPLVLLEAMASGLPAIASNISGSNDIINPEENGLLFESENHTDLANKILELYNNQNKMHYLAQNAHKHAQQFDISIMCKNYYALYRKLVKKL
ncbi:MAG: hypothetical protein A2255_00520 [Candidatus Melainabacteria bacterium RIFOXYA2_FULL_32_9]|nr:MAG: hypothetical protein A2255_00520 [Candidatus Melainabacteria bacterium RIFOXYA2_FULL_32_9]